MKLRIKSESVVAPIVGLVAGIVISAILLLLWGSNPLEAFQGLFVGAFGNLGSISNTLIKMIPLLIGGLAVVISYKSGIFNVGVESQIFFGAIGGALIATSPVFAGLPGPIQIILSMICGMLFGAILGIIPGYLKAYRGINEVVVTMLLNYIALYFLSAAVQPGGFLHETGTMANQSNPINPGTALPNLFDGTLKGVHIGLLFAIILAFVVWWVMKYSSIGFKMRSIGFSPTASEYAGMNNKLIQMNVMVIGGAMAGFAGTLEVLGFHHRLVENFAVGIGYNAIAVALLASLNPIGVIFSSLFFAMLQTGGNTMQIIAKVPASFSQLIQGTIIFFVIAGAILPKAISKLRERKRMQKESAEVTENA